MAILISIDPGNSTGVALFVNNRLVATKRTTPENYHPLVNWVLDIIEAIDLPMTLVIEIPQVYPQAQQKGDPNDLISLALKAGELKGVFESAYAFLDTVYVRPRDWKGQRPKSVCHEQMLSVLDETEVAALGARVTHDVLDAVCLGLWRLGRAR